MTLINPSRNIEFVANSMNSSSEINQPASSPLIWNPRVICMHCLLYIRSIIILFSIFLDAWIIAWSSSTYKTVLEPCRSCITWWYVAWRCVNAVLIDLSKLMIPCIIDCIIAFFSVVLWWKCARILDRFVGCVWYNRMTPPIFNCPDIIILVICHCISNLH